MMNMSGNYSQVELFCLNNLEEDRELSFIEFQWNRTLITQDIVSGLQAMVGMKRISFTFSPEQEGFFRCKFENDVSIEIGLAGIE